MSTSGNGADGAHEVHSRSVLQDESRHSRLHEFDHVLADGQQIHRDNTQVGRLLSELADEVSAVVVLEA
jgi:hypothetical protein